MTTFAEDYGRTGHYLMWELAELLAEMETLHAQPVHAQRAWHYRKVDLAARIALHNERGRGEPSTVSD